MENSKKRNIPLHHGIKIYVRFLVYGGEEELRNRGAVTMECLKQDTVADSTCESEYIAAFEASKEAIWIER
ncbi:hypothetical protein Tco_0247947 [Tanacetum coccineum]